MVHTLSSDPRVVVEALTESAVKGGRKILVDAGREVTDQALEHAARVVFAALFADVLATVSDDDAAALREALRQMDAEAQESGPVS